MLSTSQAWKDMWATGTCALETQITIQGSVFPMTSAPILERAMMQSGPSVGNVVASSLRFSVIPDTPEASAYSDRIDLPIVDDFVVDTLTVAGTTIPKSAVVIVQMRLRDGSTSTEWQPVGRYYISHRTYDPVSNLLSIECYDALLKANAEWTCTAGTTMSAALTAIAAEIGVQIDGRTVINTGADYVIDHPESLPTMRDVLAFIGAAHGGNWIITPSNMLRLVPLGSATGATPSSALNIDGVLGSINKRGAEIITGLRAGSGDDEVFIGDYNGTIVTINAAYLPQAIAQTLADGWFGNNNVTTYQSYDIANSVYDPAAELGDYIISKDDVASILFNESRTLGIAFRSSINAPESAEIADEYPYYGNAERALALARNAVHGVDVEYATNQDPDHAPVVGWTTHPPVWQTGWYIWQRTKTTSSIGISYSDAICLNAVTAEPGVGISAIVEQYYLSTSDQTQTGGSWSDQQPAWENGKYIWTRSHITWTDNTTSDTTPVLAQAINLANSTAYSANSTATTANNTATTANNTATAANNTATAANNAAQAAQAAVTALDNSLDQQEVFKRLTNNGALPGLYMQNGQLYVNGTYIHSGVIDADLIRAGIITDALGKNAWDLDTGSFVTSDGEFDGSFTAIGYDYAHDYVLKMVLENGIFKFYTATIDYDYDEDEYIYGNFVQSFEMYSENEYTIVSGGTELADVITYLNVVPPNNFPAIMSLGCGRAKIELNSAGGVGLYWDLTVNGDTQVTGSFTAFGTKSRAVHTDQYSDRLLYCYETPSPLFGDVGEGIIGQDGNCYVWLDPVFAQTISTDQYQVFLQRYGTGDCYVSERKPGYFVVTGAPGLAFGWELKAKQKDYDQRRLDNADQPSAPTTTDYGKLAIDHITDIKKARDEV